MCNPVAVPVAVALIGAAASYAAAKASAPKTPKMPDTAVEPAPPPPTVPNAAVEPKAEAQVQAARQELTNKRQALLSQTQQTSPLGLLGGATVQKKTLLGG